MKSLILAISLLVLGGCGYHCGQGGFADKYHTISIPYVEGDRDGSLTASIIRQVSESGDYEYKNCGGAILLKVKVIDVSDENIGFRYDYNSKGKRITNIIPTETRITAVAEVTVFEAASCTPLLGPVLISACVDFDHDYYNSRDEVNVFSLGQLTDYDEAYDAVKTPLEEVLAKKIVDYVNDSW